MTGTFIVHVPDKGSPQAINDLMAGNIDMMFDNISSIGPHAKAGRVKGIAVSGPRRSPVFPDLPTVAEAGVPGYETVAWGGVIGPAKLPKEIVVQLHQEIRKALAAPALLERFKQLDTEADGGTSEEFMALVKRETPKWAEVIRRSGAKVD
jgi:tripartite-type tricarboxylate transporter receptor subunit TctC